MSESDKEVPAASTGSDHSSSLESRSYIAQPPDLLRPISKQGLGAAIRGTKSLWRIVIQSLAPFKSKPDSPLEPPDHSGAICKEQLEQCIRIYDHAEATRKYLEEKARASFTMISFLAPLLFAILIFLLGRPNSTTWGICVAAIAFACLILALISTTRALSVQNREELFLGAVIDTEKGTFREYSSTFYARGLLYCASSNAAMNAHIAQFVRGAQALTSIAIIASVLAAFPAAIALADSPAAAAKMEVVGPVTISSPQFDALRSDVAKFTAQLKVLESRQSLLDEVVRLQQRVSDLELKREARVDDLKASKVRRPTQN